MSPLASKTIGAVQKAAWAELLGWRADLEMVLRRPAAVPEEDYGPCLGTQVKFHLPSGLFVTKA